MTIRPRLLGPRHGAVKVDCNMMAPTGRYMPIDAVIAGRYLAAGKPFPALVSTATIPERALGPTQSGRGLSVPMEVLGLMSPELVRPFQAIPEHVVLQMGAFLSGRHGCEQLAREVGAGPGADRDKRK